MTTKAKELHSPFYFPRGHSTPSVMGGPTRDGNSLCVQYYCFSTSCENKYSRIDLTSVIKWGNVALLVCKCVWINNQRNDGQIDKFFCILLFLKLWSDCFLQEDNHLCVMTSYFVTSVFFIIILIKTWFAQRTQVVHSWNFSVHMEFLSSEFKSVYHFWSSFYAVFNIK